MAKVTPPDKSRFDVDRHAELIDQAREDMLVERALDETSRTTALDEIDELPRDQRRRINERIAEHAEHSYQDVVTDLPNERWFQDHLAAAEALSHRYDLPVHVLIMDIAGLKYFNDTYEYSTGNTMIKSVARAMEEVSRQGESFAHRSGDEFGAVVFNGNPEVLIERLREELKKPEYAVEGKQPELYFGLATLGPRGQIGETLVEAEQLQKADKAERRAEIMARLEA